MIGKVISILPLLTVCTGLPQRMGWPTGMGYPGTGYRIGMVGMGYPGGMGFMTPYYGVPNMNSQILLPEGNTETSSTGDMESEKMSQDGTDGTGNQQDTTNMSGVDKLSPIQDSNPSSDQLETSDRAEPSSNSETTPSQSDNGCNSDKGSRH